MRFPAFSLSSPVGCLVRTQRLVRMLVQMQGSARRSAWFNFRRCMDGLKNAICAPSDQLPAPTPPLMRPLSWPLTSPLQKCQLQNLSHIR